jgi:hypothetical protein
MNQSKAINQIDITPQKAFDFLKQLAMLPPKYLNHLKRVAAPQMWLGGIGPII